MSNIQDGLETATGKTFLGGLLTRKKTSPPVAITEQVDQALDDALMRLSQSFNANEEVCAQVRRRQSSGELKLTLSERPTKEEVGE